MTRAIAVGLSLGFLSLTVVTVGGCGSRGPLDIEVIQEGLEGGGDGSVVVDGASGDDAADATMTDGVAPDGAAPGDGAPADAGPDMAMPGPLSCITCVQQQCGMDVLTCIQSTTCRTTLQCVFTMCLAGGAGGVNMQCVLMCAGNDPQSLLDLFNVIQCLGSKCGPECGGILPIPGGGGG